MTTTDLKQRSREAIDSILAQRDPPSTPWNVFCFAKDAAERDGWRFDWAAALEHWGELQRIGVVAVLGNGDTANSARPLCVVTSRGRTILARGEASPHDATRYMVALRKRVVSPDSIALEYLAEAIGAWRNGLYRASVVMLGCACERIIVLLAEHVRAVDVAPFSEKLAKMLDSGRPSNISELFALVRPALVAAAEDKRLPGELGADIVDRRLTPVFERARGLRNKSGHPTGAEIHAEEAEAGLLLFPDFHEFATRVLAELKPRNA